MEMYSFVLRFHINSLQINFRIMYNLLCHIFAILPYATFSSLVYLNEHMGIFFASENVQLLWLRDVN